jgi:hypothetical protein
MDEPNGNLTPSLEIIQDSKYIICLSKKFSGLGKGLRTVEVFTLPGNNLEYREARTKTGKRKKLK